MKYTYKTKNGKEQGRGRKCDGSSIPLGLRKGHAIAGVRKRKGKGVGANAMALASPWVCARGIRLQACASTRAGL